MIQIVVPMAGRGSRFANAGYTIPKPLIPVGGKPMIQWVIENVRPSQDHQFTFICLSEHLITYPEVPETLRALCPGCNIVTVNRVTEGAACTVLLAKDIINNEEPLMIANADQIVELNIDDYLAEMDRQHADGLIMSFESDHPKWSYCRMNDQGTVSEVVEKQVVSNEATVGIYNFRRGADFVRAAERMIEMGLRVNNEFYVAPAYNQLIEEGYKIAVMRTGREYDGMYGLGVPDDLAFFKTTTLYDKGRVDCDNSLNGNDLIRTLTHAYVNFFNTRNLAGVSALFHDNFTLEDPKVKRLQGKGNVIDYIRSIFEVDADFNFLARNVFVDAPFSVIEFDLQIGNETYRGTDVIEWQGHCSKELRSYL